ncbi:DUF4907 domain-containing protein [uncultured Kriegella sp.]|uniref:DUF4907 domain-containing protein n=1 Tax=uncultured Kriegella sp. TaxID=1798910 RepID=UPI0030D748EA|tara:strand:+ start:124072 stop:124410 length:339 start_codon:yes stop_codon:yes gene_type:complete
MKFFLNIGMLFLVGLSLFGVMEFIPLPSLDSPSYETNIVIVEDGYGYQVLKDDKLIIRQEYIPAINTKQAFGTVKDAQLLADLVVDKLKNGRSPVIALSELDDLDIVILEVQ